MSPASKKPPIFERLPNDRGLSAGYDLVGNIVVGSGLGWLLEYFWPGTHPWGLLGGFLLGVASGFYQLFKTQAPPKDPKDRKEPKS